MSRTTLPITPQTIAAAKRFVFAKWIERAKEMGRDEPVDLTSTCKFASLFAAEVFGGQMRGNFFHQWVELPDGQHLDLNDEAEDVAAMLRGEIPADTQAYAALSRQRLPSPLYTHDQRHMRTRANRDSMASIRPRVTGRIRRSNCFALVSAKRPPVSRRLTRNRWREFLPLQSVHGTPVWCCSR
jgi:hypothetical protein